MSNSILKSYQLQWNLQIRQLESKIKYNNNKILSLSKSKFNKDYINNEINIINNNIEIHKNKISTYKEKLEKLKNNEENLKNEIKNNLKKIKNEINSKKNIKIRKQKILNQQKILGKQLNKKHRHNNYLAKKETYKLQKDINYFYNKIINIDNEISHNFKNKLKNTSSNVGYKIRGIIYFGLKKGPFTRNWSLIEYKKNKTIIYKYYDDILDKNYYIEETFEKYLTNNMTPVSKKLKKYLT